MYIIKYIDHGIKIFKSSQWSEVIKFVAAQKIEIKKILEIGGNI